MPEETGWREVAPILIGIPLILAAVLIFVTPVLFQTSVASNPTVVVQARGGAENDSLAIPRSDAPLTNVAVRYSCDTSCDRAVLIVQATGAGVSDPVSTNSHTLDPTKAVVSQIDGGKSISYPMEGASTDGAISLGFPCVASERVHVLVTLQTPNGSAQNPAEATCS